MKPTDLRGILRYIPRFREKTFIIAVDGAIVTEENFANILLDVAVLRSLNIRVVLVHGASAQIKALADEHHLQASDLDGSGVTDEATLKLALTAANRLAGDWSRRPFVIVQRSRLRMPPRSLPAVLDELHHGLPDADGLGDYLIEIP